MIELGIAWHLSSQHWQCVEKSENLLHFLYIRSFVSIILPFGDSIKFCNPEKKKRITNCVFYSDILDDGVNSLGRMNIVKSAAATAGEMLLTVILLCIAGVIFICYVTTKYCIILFFLSFQKEVISWKYLKKLFFDGRCPSFLISGRTGESKIKLIISMGSPFALLILVNSLFETFR